MRGKGIGTVAKSSNEIFYMKDGKREDAAIHNEILIDVKIDREAAINLAVELGLTIEQAEILYPVEAWKVQKFSADNPPYSAAIW